MKVPYQYLHLWLRQYGFTMVLKYIYVFTVGSERHRRPPGRAQRRVAAGGRGCLSRGGRGRSLWRAARGRARRRRASWRLRWRYRWQLRWQLGRRRERRWGLCGKVYHKGRASGRLHGGLSKGFLFALVPSVQNNTLPRLLDTTNLTWVAKWWTAQI